MTRLGYVRTDVVAPTLVGWRVVTAHTWVVVPLTTRWGVGRAALSWARMPRRYPRYHTSRHLPRYLLPHDTNSTCGPQKVHDLARGNTINTRNKLPLPRAFTPSGLGPLGQTEPRASTRRQCRHNKEEIGCHRAEPSRAEPPRCGHILPG